MTPDRLKQLIFLYRNGTLTNEGRDELIAGLRDERFPGSLTGDIRSVFENSPNETLWDGELNDEIWSAIQPVVSGTDTAGRSRLKRMPLFRLRYAAAILLLVAGAGIYFFSRNTSGNTPSAEQTTKTHLDIKPGGNRAVLTLADGSTIVLDSAASGQLAVQGTTQVIKLAAGALAYSAGASGKEVLYNTISTPKGGQYQIVLPDGSKVWLNAASSIRFPTAFVNDRKVTVTGEAYFEIEKNAAMPFFVTIDDQHEIEVLGTAFNVMAYKDEPSVNTTLLQGSVKIMKGSKNAILKPGEQAQVAEAVKVIKDADINKAIAWKNGLINFEGVGLREMMRQLERWYDIEVIYEGNVPDVKFFGKMSRKVQLSTVLEALKGFGLHVQNMEGRKLIVTP